MRCMLIYQPTTRDYFPLQRSFAFKCHQLSTEDRSRCAQEIINWLNGNDYDLEKKKGFL